MPAPHVIPARRGHAVRLSPGSVIEIINPAGQQPTDVHFRVHVADRA